ncbi:DUF6265 family protein [Hyphobacterium indicum]|uniref:DUF6265 family protein n=1 Tax=Hyphobacterium indicum TaxID=2162714 RepID=UPI000F641432|nr:DUF6265 family protein [Hyphobacterium indicum]
MLKPLLATSLFMTLPALAAADDLSWMEGHWRSEADGRVSEEIWTNGEGGLYLGVNRSLRNGQASGFEYLRIINTDERTAYCAQPGGGEAVCFDQVESTEHAVTFENPDHDFPQRIRYARDGDSLTATISDLSGEQAFSFGWERVGD